MGSSYSSFPKVTRVRHSMIPNGQGVPADPAMVPGWLGAEAMPYMQRLEKELPWEKNPRTFFSYYTKLPQWAFYYSQDERKKRPCRVLEELVAHVEGNYRCNVFSVWCNLFPDGGSHIDWHQDVWGTDCITLSFGAPRRFTMRNKDTKAPVADFTLRSGDLYFFSEEANKWNEHSVPKDDASTEKRISLLFLIDYPYSKNDGWNWDVTSKKYKRA